MVSRAGPTTSALFLLCCVGSWLTSHTFPTLGPTERGKIFKELRSLSKTLLEDYVKEEKGVPTSQSYTLPCLIPDAQPPNNINISAIQTYLQTISQLRDTTTMGEIIEHLDKLKFQDASKTNISAPTGTLEHKRFILTILTQFSECMELASKLLNSEAQRAG
uniref:Interleukin 31 n=1 Tax=Prolemur simus TaxID=1328070 RepID=A0A8C9ABL7_PROSS